MKLKQVLTGVNFKNLSFDPEINIAGISDDSRKVKADYLFIAVKGHDFDGHDFIAKAIEKGASAVVCEATPQAETALDNNAFVLVPDSRKAASQIAANYFKVNSKDLTITGITGTNGKTSSAFIAASILNAAGSETALIGTLGYRDLTGDFKLLNNTTPGAVELHRLLGEFASQGVRQVVMEASSHALDQDRLAGIDFAAACFTNLTQDHLDYHKTMENYLAAKKKLFSQLSASAWAIINSDDEAAEEIKKATEARIITYGIRADADIRAEDIKYTKTHTAFILNTPSGSADIKSGLLGEHNIYNMLAAAAIAGAHGAGLDRIKKALAEIDFIPGRLQQVKNEAGLRVFVDYAHTPDALFRVLSALRDIYGEEISITTVFGCGGDRDKNKRPKMAEAAASLSDQIYITTDNPRTEDPRQVAEEVVEGFKKRAFKNYSVVLDRKQAIEKALEKAASGSIVLIAGKGHETTQIFKDKTVDFNDNKIASHILENLPPKSPHKAAGQEIK